MKMPISSHKTIAIQAVLMALSEYLGTHMGGVSYCMMSNADLGWLATDVKTGPTRGVFSSRNREICLSAHRARCGMTHVLRRALADLPWERDAVDIALD